MDHTPAYARLIRTYPHLHPSDAVPTVQEYQSLKDARSVYEEKRTRLNLEIDTLRARLNEAENQRDDLQQQIDAHTCLISPLRRVPPETLREIFATAAPASKVGLNEMVLVAPWTLLRVCRRWHEVCLMYGSLWSTVNVETDLDLFGPEFPCTFFLQNLSPHGRTLDGPGTATSRALRACELLELQLHRSLSADLFIVIETPYPGVDNYAQPFLRTLLPHLHRCVQLTIPCSILGCTPLPVLDRLTHLSMNFVSAITSDVNDVEEDMLAEERQLMQALSQQPNLRSLSAINGISPPHLPNLIPVWNRPELLTKLLLAMPYLDEHTSYAESLYLQLAECSSLAELSFLDQFYERENEGFHPGHAPDYPQQIILPNLWKLKVHSNMDGTGLTLLRRLKLPRLSDLSISVMAAEVSASIVEMLTISATKLRRLRIRADMIFRGDERDMLFKAESHLWSALETLEIETITFPDTDPLLNSNVLCLLTRTHAIDLDTCPSDVFPSLTFLDLRLMEPPLSQVIDMLESRCVAVNSANFAVLAGCRLAGSVTRYKPHRLSHIREHLPRRVVNSIFIEDEMQLENLDSREGDLAWRGDGITKHTAMVCRVEWDGIHHVLASAPKLYFSEGLEREPEQLERLRKLEKQGLELWIRRGAFLSDLG